MGKSKPKSDKPKSDKPKGKKPKASKAVPVVDPGAVGYIASAPRVDRVCTALAWANTGGMSVKVGDTTITIPTPGGWVPGWVLGHPALAGVSSDRLLRGLIADGKVEKRQGVIPTSAAIVVEYRLIP